jgi:twitching motility protein PilJ
MSDYQSPSNSSSEDFVSKILTANNLERSGQIEEAIAVYQEIIAIDTEGTYKAVAQKALENLINVSVSDKAKTEISEVPTAKLPLHQELLQKFYNLPIRKKQFATVFITQLISALSIVSVGALLIINTGKNQLVEQAKSELEVAQSNYNIKINQMGFGFKGQASNPTLVKAAETKKSSPEVKSILINESWQRQIELATLVDTQGKIISNASRDRTGDEFNPHGLVTEALAKDEQIKTTEIISYDELVAESPRFAEILLEEYGLNAASKPSFLIRYTITPVKNVATQKLGALISGDIVKLPIVDSIVDAFQGGYSAVYLGNSEQKFSLAVSRLSGDKQQISMPNSQLIEQAAAAQGETVRGVTTIDGNAYTIAAKALMNYAGEPIAILVRGTPQSGLNALIVKSLSLQGIVLILALISSSAIAIFLGQAIVKPVEKLKQVAGNFASGDREIRAKAIAADELGELTNTFNQMADSIVSSENQQKIETEKQKKEKEKLQQEVVSLLLEIEDAQKGDLTVRAKISEGAIGSVADAFNATIRRLRDLVLQVQSVSSQVSELSQSGETSVKQFSSVTLAQADEINEALNNVAEINQSIQNVAGFAQEAAQIARQGVLQAQEGGVTMDQTVSSIENIRITVEDTANKVKQLVGSSREIAKIAKTIVKISEKTNFLAFSASVEAARAGEHGRGFKIVADEITLLADRVTEATKDIQKVVGTIQKDNASVLQAMEASTTEVVAGSELVEKTKQTLQNLANTSQKIDQYLQSISSSTTEQTSTSQEINQKMAGVANIAQKTSTEVQEVVKSLRTLVKESETLQVSVSQFKLQA